MGSGVHQGIPRPSSSCYIVRLRMQVMEARGREVGMYQAGLQCKANANGCHSCIGMIKCRGQLHLRRQQRAAGISAQALSDRARRGCRGTSGRLEAKAGVRGKQLQEGQFARDRT